MQAIDLPVEQIRNHHVQDWLDANDFTGHTAHTALKSINRALNWAVGMGHIESNPITLKAPATKARENYITHDQYREMLSKANPAVHDAIVMLYETGCRPQELRAIEAKHVDGRTVYFPNGKGGKPRTIVLNDRAYALVQKLWREDGPLFRNTRDRPWTKEALAAQFRRLGFGCAYDLRHTWITNALLSGVDPVTVATLAGHASIDMVWRVYNKIRFHQSHLQEAANEVTRNLEA
jgi:integrase